MVDVDVLFFQIGLLQNFTETIFMDRGLWLAKTSCWNKLASWDGYRNIQHWGNGLWVPRVARQLGCSFRGTALGSG